MKNKALEMRRLKDRLWKIDALHLFDQAWAQLASTGKYLVPANGGWIFGSALR